MRADARIGRRRRNRVMPRFRARDGSIREASRTDSGQARDSFQQLLVVTAHVELVVAARVWIEHDFKQALLLETAIEGTQTLKATYEKACSKQQDQGERDLRDDERLTLFAGAGAYAARILLQHRGGIFAGGAPSGGETEENFS